MLKDPAAYDASLEAFSRPLMGLVEYTLDEQGRMTVVNDVVKWYAYMDMTPQVEGLFRFADRTVRTELVEELNFIENYDRTKAAIQQIVDMPDRQIDMFIRFCLQNNGHLSARKQSSHFGMLTDDEVRRMEATTGCLDSGEGSRLSADWPRLFASQLSPCHSSQSFRIGTAKSEVFPRGRTSVPT